ncbi:MAG TPA: glycosyltransferase family 1 protein [Bryobacteraceae bacterium]|jgi:glycosyltransferase involved in cell wall biosynthesis|nr:glycosyltransferase family 1 protein [Bryobacteraceae bacterium]
MLHIVIDVRRIRDFGIGTYIRNLVRSLARLDSENRYTLIARPHEQEDLAGIGANFSTAAYLHADTELIHHFTFPRFLRRFRADLYHIPLNSIAWWMPRPYVVTIHDMSTLLFPDRRDFRHTLREERYRRGALRAERIITVSQATRRDIESVLHVPSGRIHTIYSAPDPSFTASCHPGEHDRQTLERYSINYPFILYAGTIRAQKNVPRLIEAFAVLRAEFERHEEYRDLHLIVIGDEISKNPAVRRAVAQARMDSSVRFLGFVPLETLRVFYRAATVFAFPSLYEGFGLAPLEAMACGTPVVASAIPALVEAVGDAAELVSPDNVFDIARGLRAVLLDPRRRRDLADAGPRQARRFHWDRTAREVLDIYREILTN